MGCASGGRHGSGRVRTFARVAPFTLALLALVPGGAEAAPCPGDCDRDGIVSVAELVRGMTIGLKARAAVVCPAADTDADGDVSVDEAVDAVGAALHGCPPVEGFSHLLADDVAELAADALSGRNNGTPGSTAAQGILIRELRQVATALDGSTVDDRFRWPFARGGQQGTNILGIIRGRELPEEYVIVGAHYDHLGSCRRLDPEDTICNGATDNAAGAAVVLAIGRALAALPAPPRRSVVLAFWDAEEDGLLGSQHFTQNPAVPLASTVAYVNFDIQGANLLPSLRTSTFAVGAETGGSVLVELVRRTAGRANLDVHAVSYIVGQGRSDYVNFVNAGVPTVFFSDSTGPCYHTTADEVSVVDFAKLGEQSRAGYELTLALADGEATPEFVPPSPSLATFDDAVIIDEAIRRGQRDLDLFGPPDRARIARVGAEIAAIVRAGRARFGPDQVSRLLLGTLEVIDALTRIECDGFL
jgi:hypothetical protein